MEITWKHLGTTGTALGHLLGQFEDHLATQENCMDNTIAPLGTTAILRPD